MESTDDIHFFGDEQRIVRPDRKTVLLVLGILILLGLAAYCALVGPEAFSQTQIPGTDASDKMEAAGTVLRLIDTALFKWSARLLAGVCLLSAGWSLKEQRIGIAIICVGAALLFGTAPTWVRNIFSISGSDSVFGLNVVQPMQVSHLATSDTEGHVYA